jgi:thiol-disulfide isomerase/thioredoxin
MNMTKPGLLLAVLLIFPLFFAVRDGLAATNLKLNPNLDYTSDSNDGPLITGDQMSYGVVGKGKPAYVIFYHRKCYNSKRQARRTVELYKKYGGKVDFIVVDLDSPLSKEQKELRSRHYRNYIPHVTIIDGGGTVVYDKRGEVSTERISGILDPML